MGIKITNADTLPALIFENFFLDKLELSQKIELEHAKPPYYVLRITYRMFAVDGEGKRHFEPKTNTLEIQDYAAVAYAKAMAGDPDLANAAGAIEHALAKIIEDQTNFGEATVL